MKLISMTVVIACPLFLIGCVADTFDRKLKIVNNTRGTIFVNISKNRAFKSHPIATDLVKGDTLWNYMRWISPLDSLNSQPPFGKWESYIDKKCEDSTLSIFIFENELLKSVAKETLVSKQLYSKKFSYKVKDLEKLNWRVEYKK